MFWFRHINDFFFFLKKQLSIVSSFLIPDSVAYQKWRKVSLCRRLFVFIVKIHTAVVMNAFMNCLTTSLALRSPITPVPLSQWLLVQQSRFLSSLYWLHWKVKVLSL